jgi:hypothetical protein
MPRRNSHRLKGTLILAVTALLLGGMLLVRNEFLEPPRDEKTHCLPKRQEGQTVVFIDKTDRWNDHGSERLVAHMLRLVQERMRDEELLRIYIFGERISHGFEAAFTACKPPLTVPSNIIDSEAFRRRKFEEVFGGPLRKVMEEAKKPEEGLCSPIAEVTVEVLSRVEVKHWAGPTRLVYFSDMAQNSQIYSAFRSTRCFPINAQKDHTSDGRPLIQHFERHRTMMNLANTSAIVFQVIPDKNPPHIKDTSKAKWSDAFRALSIDAEWELL